MSASEVLWQSHQKVAPRSVSGASVECRIRFLPKHYPCVFLTAFLTRVKQVASALCFQLACLNIGC